MLRMMTRSPSETPTRFAALRRLTVSDAVDGDGLVEAAGAIDGVGDTGDGREAATGPFGVAPIWLELSLSP